MRVHTRTLYEYDPDADDYVLLEDDWYDYDGPVAEVKGGGGTSTNTTQTIQQADPWSGVQPYLRQGYSQALTNLRNPPEFYPGNSFAPFDPLQQQAQQMQLGAVPGLQDYVNMAQQSSQFGLSPDILSPESNPYLAAQGEAAIRPLYEQLTEQILPAIRGGAVNAGQYGGSRQGIAEGLAARGTQQAAGDALANLYSGAYGQGLQHMARSQALAPGLASLSLAPSAAVGDVGAQRQAMSQNAINDALARWNFQQNLPQQQLTNYMQTLAGFPLGSAGSMSGTTTGSQPYYSSPGLGALGGGLLGYQLGPSLGLAAGPAGLAGALLLGGLL
jgi:hypothetical protein